MKGTLNHVTSMILKPLYDTWTYVLDEGTIRSLYSSLVPKDFNAGRILSEIFVDWSFFYSF